MSILISAIFVVPAQALLPDYAFSSAPESPEERRPLAQDTKEDIPVIVNASCTTDELIQALKHARYKHQRRLAAEILGQRGEKEVLPHLLEALKDQEEVVQKAVAESLAMLGDAGIQEELISNLKSPEPGVRKYSVYVLGRLGTKENSRLVEAVESLAGDKDGNIRAETFYAMYEIGSPSSRSIFIEGLNDKESRVRSYSATALGDLKGEEAEQALALAFQRETDENVRRVIVSALGKHGSAGAVEVLVNALPHETTSVRADIAAALGETKTPDAIEALIELLSDRSANVRTKAAESLLKAKDRSAKRALANALNDPALTVRRPASETLIYIADISVMSELIQALGDRDNIVANNAMEALVNLNDLEIVHGLIKVIDSSNYSQAARAITVLEEITHGPYGSNVEKWKRWYHENFKTSK